GRRVLHPGVGVAVWCRPWNSGRHPVVRERRNRPMYTAMTEKALDSKLRRIHADPRGCKDFILADAKDADMALAIGAPGRSPEAHSGELRYCSLAEFRDVIEQIVEQGLVDIMLMSASTSEVLTVHKRIFDRSPVT